MLAIMLESIYVYVYITYTCTSYGHIYVYIYMYIYICIYIYTYTYIYTYIHPIYIYIYPRSCFVSYQRLVVLSSTSHEFTAPTLHSCAVHRCSVCKALCAAAMACELWISEHPEKSNFQWILGGLTLI